MENQNFSLPLPKVDVETLSSSTTKSRSSQETVSLSDYFREGTSNIGCSLEHSNGSARSIKRPDFGLSVLKSPLRRPVKVIEETLIENHNSLNESLEKKVRFMSFSDLGNVKLPDHGNKLALILRETITF